MLILWSKCCQDWKMALHCKQVLGRHGLTFVAVVVVHVVIVRIEVEVPRIVRVVRVERRRPVVAVGTGIVEVAVVAVAGSGQEDTTRFASAVLLFSRAKECRMQANAPIDAIPHICTVGRPPMNLPLSVFLPYIGRRTAVQIAVCGWVAHSVCAAPDNQPRSPPLFCQFATDKRPISGTTRTRAARTVPCRGG